MPLLKFLKEICVNCYLQKRPDRSQTCLKNFALVVVDSADCSVDFAADFAFES